MLIYFQVLTRRCEIKLRKENFGRLAVYAAVAWGLVAIGSSTAHSQGALVLQYQISARSAALGDTGVGDNSDPSNIYFNPANVVGTRGAYVNGTRWDFPFFSDDIWIGRLSGGARFELGDGISFGADVSYGRLDYGESIATDIAGNPIGEVHAFEDFGALTAGVGLHFGDDWEARFGVSGKRYHGHYPLAEVSPTPGLIAEFGAFAFDLGTTIARRYRTGDWNVTPALAVACVNLGDDIDMGFPGELDALPTRLHFGSSVHAESPTARILGADVPVLAMVYNLEAVDRMHDAPFSWGIGGEIAVAQIVFVRAGTSDFEEDTIYDDDEEGEFQSQSGWGVGVGLPVGSVRTRFDYTKISDSYTEKKLGFSIDWIF